MACVAIPARRIGRLENVAGLALYLASDPGDFVTGATLDENGGLIMR